MQPGFYSVMYNKKITLRVKNNTYDNEKSAKMRLGYTGEAYKTGVLTSLSWFPGPKGNNKTAQKGYCRITYKWSKWLR
jgi:hypothetical protein